jgi:hypothetical protein
MGGLFAAGAGQARWAVEATLRWFRIGNAQSIDTRGPQAVQTLPKGWRESC